MSLEKQIQPIIITTPPGYYMNAMRKQGFYLEDDICKQGEAFRKFEEMAYRDIITSVSDVEPVVMVNTNEIFPEDTRQKLASVVAKYSENYFPIVMSLYHYASGMVFDKPDVAYVTFDAHNDSDFHEDNAEYNNGNFLAFRKGESYVLGTSVGLGPKTTKIASRRKANSLVDKIPNDIFLSLDIDCYESDVTSAFRYNNAVFPFEKSLRKYGLIHPHFTEDEVLELSSKIVNGRNVLGLDLSEYCPLIEFFDLDLQKHGSTTIGEFDYSTLPTVGVLKRYLQHVIGEIKKDFH